MNSPPEIPSPYYPPRANWRSRLFYPWQRFLQASRLNRLPRAGDLSVERTILCLFVPGLSLMWLGWPMLGRWLLMGYSLGLATFIATLGFPIANLAFGLMISTHVSSLAFLLQQTVQETSPWRRAGFTLGLVAVVGLLVYQPLFYWFQARWYSPYLLRGQVLVVDRHTKPGEVHRGDWIAHEIASHYEPGLVMREGMGLDRVMAMAGDRVEFTPKALRVNGEIQPRHPRLPSSGEMVVPQKHWLVYPDLRIGVVGNVDSNVINRWVLEAALVSEDQFRGKARRTWLGRPQY